MILEWFLRKAPLAVKAFMNILLWNEANKIRISNSSISRDLGSHTRLLFNLQKKTRKKSFACGILVITLFCFFLSIFPKTPREEKIIVSVCNSVSSMWGQNTHCIPVLLLNCHSKVWQLIRKNKKRMKLVFLYFSGWEKLNPTLTS